MVGSIINLITPTSSQSRSKSPNFIIDLTSPKTSRSKSPSKSQSKSKSKSPPKPKSKSKSKSKSPPKPRSKSKSKSKSPPKSQSKSRSKSKSPPKPKSKSRSKSKSKSKSPLQPKSKSRSKSKSPPKPKSLTKPKAKSLSKSKSPPSSANLRPKEFERQDQKKAVKEANDLIQLIKKANKEEQLLRFADQNDIQLSNLNDYDVDDILQLNKSMKLILSIKQLKRDEFGDVIRIFESLPGSVEKKMFTFATRKKFVTLDENNEPEIDMDSLDSFQLYTLVTYIIKALNKEMRLKKTEEDAKTFLIQATQIMERRKLYTEKPDTLMDAELFESLFANGEKYEGDEILRSASKGRYYVTRQDIGEEEIPFCFAFTLNNGQEVVLEGFFNNYGGLDNNENQKYKFPLNKKDQENDSSLGIFHKLILRQGPDEIDVTNKSVYELKAIGSDKGKNLNKPEPMKILIHFPMPSMKMKDESSNLVTLSCNILVDLNTAKVILWKFRPIALFQIPEVVVGKGQECKRSEKKSERQLKKPEKLVKAKTENEQERNIRHEKQKKRNKYLNELWDDKVMNVNRQYTSEEEKDYARMLRKHDAKRAKIEKRKKKEVEEQALKNKIFTENEFVNINEQLSEKNQESLALFAYNNHLASEKGQFLSTWDEMSHKDKLELTKLATDLFNDQKREEQNERKRKRREKGKEEEDEEEENEEEDSSDSDYS